MRLSRGGITATPPAETISSLKASESTAGHPSIAERKIQFRRKSATSLPEACCILSAFFSGHRLHKSVPAPASNPREAQRLHPHRETVHGVLQRHPHHTISRIDDRWCSNTRRLSAGPAKTHLTLVIQPTAERKRLHVSAIPSPIIWT